MGVWQNVCVADTGTEKAQHKVMGNVGSINERVSKGLTRE
jgi:hypothetical protein